MDPLIGQILDGRYAVESRIGEGGIGTIYKARHIAMGQSVALKFLHTDQANDPTMVQRFIQEARSTFRIDHPNCVRVTDFCATDDGTLFIVMDYLDGRTVAQEVAVDGPIQSARVQHIAAQVADALAHAHQLGLIHRDLKPDNIMLLKRSDDYDFAKIFDFGLAKLFDQGALLTGLTISPLTRAGMIFGTPAYMSPEQAIGSDLSPASDIYSLGICCYEMLTGQVPFASEAFTLVLSQHVKELPLPPGQKRPDLAIDPRLDELVMACLQKDASARPDARQLAEALRGSGSVNHQAEAKPPYSLASSETITLASQSAPDMEEGSQTPSRLPWIALLPVALLVGFFAWPSSETAGGADTTAPALKPAAPSEADLLPAERSVIQNDAALAPADQIVTQTPDGGSAESPPPRRLKSVNPHLKAAEAAFRAKNELKQLAEADAALRHDPGSRRAAYLLADALLKSGDKVRACKYFRRSSKKHYRAAGCDD